MSATTEAEAGSAQTNGAAAKPSEQVETVVIRFCGDSGDGMQLVGTQFTNVSAAFGNDVSTLPDPPAEIRAPAGALAGVSGLQVHFSSQPIDAPADLLNALVAMNPAALLAHVGDLEPGGILIANADAFDSEALHQAGYAQNPLTDGSLGAYRLLAVPMTTRNRDAVARAKLTPKEAGVVTPYHRAALAALRDITSKDAAPTADAWRKLLNLPAKATEVKTSQNVKPRD